MQSLTNLSSTVKLLTRKFSRNTYRNCLKRGTSKLMHPKYSKSTSHVSSIPFVKNSHFSILAHKVRQLKNFLCLQDNRSSFSRVKLKSQTKDALQQKAVHFWLQKICFSENARTSFYMTQVFN